MAGTEMKINGNSGLLSLLEWASTGHYMYFNECDNVVHLMPMLYMYSISEASCKWRDAQRAMRNRKFIGYTLVHFECDMLGKGEYQSLYKELVNEFRETAPPGFIHETLFSQFIIYFRVSMFSWIYAKIKSSVFYLCTVSFSLK